MTGKQIVHCMHTHGTDYVTAGWTEMMQLSVLKRGTFVAFNDRLMAELCANAN